MSWYAKAVYVSGQTRVGADGPRESKLMFGWRQVDVVVQDPLGNGKGCAADQAKVAQPLVPQAGAHDPRSVLKNALQDLNWQ